MKKWIMVLLVCGLMTACEEKKETPAPTAFDASMISTPAESSEVLFFTKSMCPYCNHAAAYLSTQYPDLAVTFVDIETPAGWERFLETVDALKLDTRRLGTPLIVVGDRYILGWSTEEKKNLDALVGPLLK